MVETKSLLLTPENFSASDKTVMFIIIYIHKETRYSSVISGYEGCVFLTFREFNLSDAA